VQAKLAKKTIAKVIEVLVDLNNSGGLQENAEQVPSPDASNVAKANELLHTTNPTHVPTQQEPSNEATSVQKDVLDVVVVFSSSTSNPKGIASLNYAAFNALLEDKFQEIMTQDMMKQREETQ